MLANEDMARVESEAGIIATLICSAFAEATASTDHPFSKMKEEPNDQNLQHTETKPHRKNPFGR